MPESQLDTAEEFVREVPMLARLSDADVKALALTGRYLSFERGDVIMNEGDTDSSMHLVIDGEVRVSVLSPAGEEATLARIGPGRPVGEFSLLDGRPRSATVTAERRTKTFVVSRESFLAWLETRPRAAAALLETLSLRIRRTDEALSDVFFFELRERLAKQLLRLADSSGEPAADGVRIRITQAELATMLGVSREAVNKQLARFAAGGLVRTGRGSVTLVDAKGIRALV